VVSISIFIPYEAFADTLIKLQHFKPAARVSGFETPELTDTIFVWLGTGRARIDLTPDNSTIYRAEGDQTTDIFWKMEIYTPKEVTTQSPTESGSSAAVDLSAGMAELSPQIVSTVTETEQRRTISGYNCQLWLQRDSMPQMELSLVTEVWATEDISADRDLYYRIIEAPVQKAGLEQSFAEHRKVRGMPVLSTMVATTDSTGLFNQLIGTSFKLISCEEVDVEPGHYEVPRNFERFPNDE